MSRIKNPRLENTAAERRKFIDDAKRANVPVHDRKNEGPGDDAFLEVLDRASKDRRKIGSYATAKPQAGRGTYSR
ncbi:MAG: hypothetical protein ACKO1J_02100 [Tagaea sp.]